MKKFSCYILTILIIFVSCLILGGCNADKTEKSIIGKWELSDEFSPKGIRIPSYIEFFSDGSVQSDWGGKYSIDGEKLNIYYSAMDSYTYTFEIDNSVLSLKSDISEFNNDETEYIYFKTGSENFEYNESKSDIADIKLSDSCDSVLAEGTDINGNYYELVATQEDTYNSTVIKLGVIKNNEWLVDLSTDHPFIDGDSGLLWSYDYYGYSYNYCTTGIDECSLYSFIGNGSFYHEGTFYNSETNKYYKDDYVKNGEMHDSPNDFIIPYTYYQSYDTDFSQKVTDAENVIMILEKDDSTEYVLLNTSSMTTTVLKNVVNYTINYSVRAPFSEGLYLVREEELYGFYNKNGEKVIDLSNYNITESYLKDEFEGIFINGQATFSVLNETGKRFKITIDKTGEILSQEMVENNAY